VSYLEGKSQLQVSKTAKSGRKRGVRIRREENCTEFWWEKCTWAILKTMKMHREEVDYDRDGMIKSIFR
jgi:hypothetical protein